MDLLRDHWEKFALLLTLLIAGYFGYDLYQTTRISLKERKMYALNEKVEEALNREPEMSVRVPNFRARASAPWNIRVSVSEGRDWVFHFPLLNQPSQVIRKKIVHRMPAVEGLSARSSVEQGVTLEWTYETLTEGETLKRVVPETVRVLRKQKGDEEWQTIEELQASGTGPQQYIDQNVTPQETYVYRIALQATPPEVVDQRANHVFVGPTDLRSDPVTVTTEPVIKLTFTGTAGEGAFITVEKYDREKGGWRKNSFRVDPGKRIGDGFFQTPYTLKKWTLKMVRYWWLNEKRTVGAEGQETWTAKMDVRKAEQKVIVYTDPDGNTHELKKKRKLRPNEIRTARPWENEKYDKFISRVKVGPQGHPVPDEYYVPEPGDDGEEKPKEDESGEE